MSTPSSAAAATPLATGGIGVVLGDGGALPAALQGLTVWPDLGAALGDPTAQLLVVFTGAQAQIGQALRGGDDPAVARQTWLRAATALLDPVRRSAGRVVLMERAVLEQDPLGSQTALRDRLPDLHLPEAASAPTPAPEEPALWLLADALVQRDPQARALSDELEARALRTATAPEGLEAAALHLSETLRRKGPDPDEIAAALADEQSRHAEERRLFGDSVAQLQAELERSALDLQVRQAALEAAERRRGLAQTAARRREALLGAVTLQDMSTLDSLRADVAGLEAALAQAQAEIAALHGSTSWKVTRPIRALRRGLGPTG